MKSSLIPTIVAAAALAAGASAPYTAAWASGLTLDESSAAEIGNAHAGPAAADDASTIVWNPAGMSYLPGVHFTANLTGIYYKPEFSNSGSTSVLGLPMTGDNGGNAGGVSALPSLFFTAQLMPDLTAGVGVYTPFGLKVQYDDNTWVGRYQTVKSDFETLNINPSIAWKATQQLSLAAGMDIMRAEADLTRATDFGSLCFAQVGPGACTAAGITQQGKDGMAELSGSSWGYGFNLGAMFQIKEGTRVGLTYRSAIREDVQGGASFANPALPGPFAALTASPQTNNSAFTSTIWLPESVNGHFIAKLTDELSVLGNVNWTRWDRLNELRAKFTNGAPDNVTTFNWRNTWNFSLGVNYQIRPQIKLRGGVEWETDASRYGYRNPLVPESTRKLIAVGVNYKFTPQDSVDVGYSHVFFNDISISSTTSTGGTLNGTYKVSADLFAIQYNRTF